MPTTAITRVSSTPATLTVDISVDADLTSDSLCIAGAAMGMIWIPANFDGTQIIYHVCATKDGTFLPLGQISDGAALTHTVAASKAFPMPEAAFGAAYVKVETVTDQATTDTVFIFQTKG
jgi:hypothetical protein